MSEYLHTGHCPVCGMKAYDNEPPECGHLEATACPECGSMNTVWGRLAGEWLELKCLDCGHTQDNAPDSHRFGSGYY